MKPLYWTRILVPVVPTERGGSTDVTDSHVHVIPLFSVVALAREGRGGAEYLFIDRFYCRRFADPAVGGARGREKLGHERVRRPFLASGNRVKKAGEKNGRGHEAV